METFPVVEREDEQKYGESRSKHVILEIHDAMIDTMQPDEIPDDVKPLFRQLINLCK